MDDKFREPFRWAEAAFRGHPDGIQIYHPADSWKALHLVYANPQADRLLGMDSASHSGAAMEYMFPAARERDVPKSCLQVLRENRARLLGDFHWIGDGKMPRWLALSAFPCFEDCIGLKFEDITERRNIHTALKSMALELNAEVERRRRSESLLSQITYEWTAVFDSLTELVSVVDETFCIRRANRALAEFIGCEPRDLIGRKCYEVMHGLDAPWENCPHVACLRDGKSTTQLIEDSTIGRPLMVTCSPLKGLPGQTGCSVHVARDISVQRAAEKVREDLIRDLEEALAQVQVLRGLIPICAWCKKVRDDAGFWEQLESYFQKHSQAQFTHGLCPDCARKML